jgi:molybdate transport system permease protein
MNLVPLLLSMKLALVTTVILLLVSIPISYWLSNSTSFFKPFLEAIISLPIVLPPSVLGFYLLLAFSPRMGIAKWLSNEMDIRLAFSFSGLVIASIIYSLPFMIHPIQSGFQQLPSSLKEASYTLGASNFKTFYKVLLPSIKSSVLTGIVLTFAHTIGEFGVIMMIGGSIEGETKVASVAIYDEVESMNYVNANEYALMLLSFSFVILLLLFWFKKRNLYQTIPL